mgnify:CR=1 FL=1
MKKHTLKAQKREMIGRKVKKLRLAGSLPATVYGKKLDSENLIVSLSDFTAVFVAAGETGLIELVLEGETKPVLIHHVQRHPVKDTILHVEFYQVDLKEKVHAKVPVVLIGESSIVVQKIGVLLSLITEVEVEALPTDLPEKIEVDVSVLTAVDQELKVSDLQIPAGVTVLSDASVGVVKVGALVSRAAEEQAAADAAAQAVIPAEAEQADAGEGADVAEAPVEKKPEEEKKPETK